VWEKAKSLAKPGGNVTGVSLLAPEVAGKWMALLKELIPSVTNVALLWNPDDPTVHLSVEESKAAAARLLLTLQILETREAGAIEGAIRAAENERTQALVLMPTPLYDGQAEQIAEIAMSMRLPTVHFSKHAVQRGILMSYGPTCSRLSAGRRFCRSHPQGSKAGRPSGRATDDVRAGH
jgi:putative ABC transport system substrate-binding protein